jgi:uracil-DNA glycosylase
MKLASWKTESRGKVIRHNAEDSYHCSRYNTETKRLNEAMFHAIFSEIVQYIHSLDLDNSLEPNNRV